MKSYLGDFLFAPERTNSPIKTLSGGERNRLLLARLFARPANVLVLDEPTNDLDIDTLDLLEQLLQDYPGTVFLVSHDRTFLDNVVTSMIAYEGEARWREYEGGYEDYVVQKARSDIAIEATTAKVEVSKSAVTVKPSANPPRSKLSNKEKMELEQIPGRIEMLEQEQLRLSDQLANPELYKGDPQAIVHLKTQLAELEKQMQSSLTRWENLLAKETS